MTSQKSRYIKWFVVIASLFPSIFVMISQSAKGMLFLCVAIFYGGILVAGIQRGNFYLISKRALPSVTIGFITAIVLVTVSFIARGVSAGAGEGLIDALAPYWASYTSGHLFAFSDWFGFYIGDPSAQSYDDPGLTNGFYTFMSIFKIFGDDRPVPLGIYAEYLSIPPYIQTNIYTVYRGLITDFGLTGSLLALAVFSFLAHRAYNRIISKGTPAFSAAAFILTVAFIYQSFGVSSFTWTTLPMGLILIGITLFLVKFRNNNQGRSPIGLDRSSA